MTLSLDRLQTLQKGIIGVYAKSVKTQNAFSTRTEIEEKARKKRIKSEKIGTEGMVRVELTM